MKNEHTYSVKSLGALSAFQLLEFSLKLYISASYNVIRESLQGKLPFRYEWKDIENYPLERLLNIFRKLNDNSDLHKRLNKLRDGRNHLAHKALLTSIPVYRSIVGESLEDSHANIEAIEIEVDACLAVIAVELGNVIRLQGDKLD